MTEEFYSNFKEAVARLFDEMSEPMAKWFGIMLAIILAVAIFGIILETYDSIKHKEKKPLYRLAQLEAKVAELEAKLNEQNSESNVITE